MHYDWAKMEIEDSREASAGKEQRSQSNTTGALLPPCNLVMLHRGSIRVGTVIAIAGVAVLFAAFYIILSYEANEVYTVTNYDSENTTTDVLRLLSLTVSLCQIAVLVHYHRSRIKLQPPLARSFYVQVRPGLGWKWSLAEVLLHCMVLPPGVNAQWTVYQLGTYAHLTLSDILFVLSLARIYHLIRAIYWVSGYNSLRARFYSGLLGVDSHTQFVWRSAFKRYALLSFALAWGLLNMIGGIALRTFDHSVPSNQVDTLWSAFWSVVVSETTIGYGDVIPLTHMARLTILLANSGGVAIYAYVILTVHRSLEMNPRQHKLYGEVYYSEMYNRLRTPAAVLLQRWWTYHLHKTHKLPTLKCLAKLNFHLRGFRLARRKFMSLQTPLLSQSVLRFDREVVWRIKEEIDRLRDVRSIENLVRRT